MTTPIATGFPDWGRRRPSSDALYLEEPGLAINANVTYGPYYVGDVQHIAIFQAANANNISIEYVFYLESTLVTQLGFYTIDCNQGGTCETTIPVRGPFMTAQVIIAVPATNFSLVLASSRTPAADRNAGSTGNVLLWTNGAAFAAGLTVAYTYPGAAPGPANISALWRQLGAGYCQVYSIDFAGAFTTVAAFNMSISSGPPTLWLPATPIRVVVHNSAAAAQTLDFGLTVPWSYIT